MRARNIKPGYFKNDELAECEPLARILFIGLWCMADRAGRLEHRPKKIKAEILPYDDCDIDDLLQQLETHRFILRYEHGGAQYIQVLNFGRHQNPHMREPESKLPAPPGHSASTMPAQCEHDASTVPASDEHESGPADSGFLIPDSGFRIPEESPNGLSFSGADAPKEESFTHVISIKPKRNPVKLDPLMEAVCEVTGTDWSHGLGRLTRKEIMGAVNDLREMDATPDEVRRRAEVYRRRYPNADLTPFALAKHWARLHGAKARDEPLPEYYRRQAPPLPQEEVDRILELARKGEWE